MAIARHVTGSIKQHIDALLIAQAIDMQHDRAVYREIESLKDLFAAFPRCILFQVNTVGNNASGSAQAVIVQEIEGGGRGSSDILAAVTKIDQVGIADVAERLAKEWIRRKRTAHVDG